MKNNEYVLDFVIPVGPTGPTGPIGPISLTALKTILYNNITVSGNLTISSSRLNLILPDNTPIFTQNNNSVILNESGYYEFSFYGILKDSGTQKGNLILKASDTPIISINLSSGTNEICFSQTIVVQCNSNETITVELNKPSNSNASAENVYLLIKKLYFQ